MKTRVEFTTWQSYEDYTPRMTLPIALAERKFRRIRITRQDLMTLPITLVERKFLGRRNPIMKTRVEFTTWQSYEDYTPRMTLPITLAERKFRRIRIHDMAILRGLHAKTL